MKNTILLIAGILLGYVVPSKSQFVVTPFRVQYVTNGTFIQARCSYLLDTTRDYVGEQIDTSGKKIRNVGLATVTTGGGTAINSAQIQSSIVQPVVNATLYRIIDVTGASASRIAELRDIPVSIYPPSASLVPSGIPAYKTTLSKGVFSLTAERKFGEWFLLEEFRYGVWQQARWMPIGGKATVILGQRYIGTGEPPTWRVSKWKIGNAVPMPPTPANFSFTPSEAYVAPLSTFAAADEQSVIITTNIVDKYYDNTNGLFYAWAWQRSFKALLFEDADEPTGPWTERAYWSCYNIDQLIVAAFNGALQKRYVRARLVDDCGQGTFVPSEDIMLGENIQIPTSSGPKAVARLVSPRMRLSPGVTLYLAMHPHK
jgi:hypothetical protein